MSSSRSLFWIRVGAALGFLAVLAGAFGAHGLREHLTEHALENWETAARYQMYHALAILAVGVMRSTGGSKPAGGIACILFLIGIVLFSGSLYAWAILQAKWLVMITPIGGVALLAGWIAFAVSPFGAKPAASTSE